MNDEIKDNTTALLVIRAVLQEYLKLYPCTYTELLNTCNMYIDYGGYDISTIDGFIKKTFELLKIRYHADHLECLKINKHIQQLHHDYKYLNDACGPFLIYVFDSTFVHTDLINNLIRLRQDLHERLLFIGYNTIRN